MIEVGSLVECVLDGKGAWRRDYLSPAIAGPSHKERLIVAGRAGVTGLLFDEYPTPDNKGFNQRYFKKIDPPLDIEGLLEECLNTEKVTA